MASSVRGVAVAVCLVSCSPSASEPPEPLAQQASAVIHGGAIAAQGNLYGVSIWKAGNYECTGTLLNARGWVLTAKHCVAGPASAYTTTRAISSGPFPANAAPVAAIVNHPTLDLALIQAPDLAHTEGKVSPGQPDRVKWDGYGTPLYLGPTSSLAGLVVAASGYGVDHTGLIGSAGTARFGLFTVTSPSDATGTYQLPNASSPSGVVQMSVGDDGGASFFIPASCTGCSPVPWTLAGTHTVITGSTGAPGPTTDTSIGASSSWLSSQLGFTLETLERWTTDGQRRFLDGTGGTAKVRPFAQGSTFRWEFDVSSGQLKSGGRCLEAAGTTDGSVVQVKPCTGAVAQRFKFLRPGQLRAELSGKCLSLATGSALVSDVVVRTCTMTGTDGPNQEWVLRVAQLEDTGLVELFTPRVAALGDTTTYPAAKWTIVRYTSQGMPTYAFKCIPAAASGPTRTQVLAHGGGAGAGASDLALCRQGAQNGWLTFVPAYRGEPLYGPNAADTVEVPYWSAGTVEVCLGEVDDVLRLVELLRASPTTVDVNRMIMLGFSHGGCITTRATQRGALVQRAADWSGPSDWRDLYWYCADDAAAHPGSVCDTFGGSGLAPWLAGWIGSVPPRTGTAPNAWRWRSPAAYTSDLAARGSAVKFLKIHGAADPLVPLAQGCNPASFTATPAWKSWQADGAYALTTAALPGCTPPTPWSSSPIAFTATTPDRALLIVDPMMHVGAPPAAWLYGLGVYSAFVAPL